MKYSKAILTRALLATGLAAAVVSIATAQPTAYWDADANAANNDTLSGLGLGGSGAWDTGIRWYYGVTDTSYVANSDVVFTGTSGVVTFTAPQSVNSILFKTTGYTVSGSSLMLTGPNINTEAGVSALINSPISGTVGLVKSGTGTLNLQSAHNYAGGTTISGGTLVIDGTLTGSAVVLSGGTMAGVGTIGGSTTVFSGGHLSPGNSAGTISMNGLGMQNGTFLHADIGPTSDQVVVTTNLAVNGTLDVQLASGFTPSLGQTFTLMTAAAVSGTFATESVPTFSFRTFDVIYNPQSVVLKVVPVLSGDYNTNGKVDGADYVVWRNGLGTIYTPADYDVWRAHFGETAGSGASLSAVPEPTTWMLLMAAAAMLLVKLCPPGTRRAS